MAVEDYQGGAIVYKLRLDEDESVRRKMDLMAERSGKMDRFFDSFSHGGAAMAATMAAIGSLGASGQGVQSILGAFQSLTGALVDIVTLPLIPFVMPFMGDMIGLLRDVAAARGDPSAMFDALGKGASKLWSDSTGLLAGLWESLQPTMHKLGDWLTNKFDEVAYRFAGILIATLGAFLVSRGINDFAHGNLIGGGLEIAGGIGAIKYGAHQATESRSEYMRPSPLQRFVGGFNHVVSMGTPVFGRLGGF